MQLVGGLVLAATLLVLRGVAQGAGTPIPYGFEAMERPELLPLLLPNGTQTKQFASYDTTGGETGTAGSSTSGDTTRMASTCSSTR